MRILAAVLILCVAVPAFAQAPPSKTLERAIRLYDKKDFFVASIELSKVISGETGDGAEQKQRAVFFQAKTLYQLGFYAVSWSSLAGLVEQRESAYSDAAAKWLIAILRVAPNPSVRSTLFAYDLRNTVDDPMLADVRDEFAYQLGRELAQRDTRRALVNLSKIPSDSPFAARGLLERGRAMLREKDPKGFDVTMVAAVAPEQAGEAARLIASAAHLNGMVEQASRPLAAIAKSNAYALYQHSRTQLDAKLPGLALVPIETFDAVIVPSACHAKWPDDIKPLARQVIDQAKPLVEKIIALDDNAEVYEYIRRIHKSPATPGGDVVLAAIVDPDLQERIAWLAEIDNELGLLQRADKAWQTTPVAAEILQELTVLQAVEMANIGAHVKQQLQRLATTLPMLETALAQLSPAVPLSVGPDGVLVMTAELCAGGGPSAIAASPATRPTSGCAGCATRESSWSVLVLFALVLAKMLRRDRRRAAR
jgi:hypothetical protein